MKTSTYYIYNNIAIIACTITAILHKYSGYVALSKITILIPFLLDDNISEKIVNQDYRSFESLTQQNRIALANFNERYNDLLPLIIDGIAILLDMNVISLYGDSARLIDEQFYETMLQDNESKRLASILIAADKLILLTGNLEMSKVYTQMNILL